MLELDGKRRSTTIPFNLTGVKYGKEYVLWLVEVRFSNGQVHLAVAYSVQGGRFTILDLTGQYYTGMPGPPLIIRPISGLDRYSRRCKIYLSLFHA